MILMIINFVLIKRSKKILIPFYIILGIVIPNIYYIFLIQDKFLYYVLPSIMNVIALATGLFIWKKNRKFVIAKMNRWKVHIGHRC